MQWSSLFGNCRNPTDHQRPHTQGAPLHGSQALRSAPHTRGKQGPVWTRPLSSQSRTSVASNTHGGSFLRPRRTGHGLYCSLAARPLWCQWSAIPGAKIPRAGLGRRGADAALPPTSTDTRRCGSEPFLRERAEREAERAGELQAGVEAEGRWGREWAARSPRTEAGPDFLDPVFRLLPWLQSKWHFSLRTCRGLSRFCP